MATRPDIVSRDATAPVPIVEAAPAGLSVRRPGLARRLAILLESKASVIGLGIVLFWVAMAILAPIISPYSPTALTGALAQPPSATHWLGTDHIGRDVLSRLIWGSRVILVLAPLSVICALAVGTLLVLMAGYLCRLFY